MKELFRFQIDDDSYVVYEGPKSIIVKKNSKEMKKADIREQKAYQKAANNYFKSKK